MISVLRCVRVDGYAASLPRQFQGNLFTSRPSRFLLQWYTALRLPVPDAVYRRLLVLKSICSARGGTALRMKESGIRPTETSLLRQ